MKTRESVRRSNKKKSYKYIDSLFNAEELISKGNMRKFKEISKGTAVNKSSISISNKRSSYMNEQPDIEEIITKEGSNKSKFVIFPEASIKVAWDLLGLVFILYQAIIIPFRICFDTSATGGLATLEIIVDFFFLTDIILTANTGYYNNGLLIMNRCQIILNYLKLWFWLDISASFPYNLLFYPDNYFDVSTPIESTSARAPQILRILKIMRFIRFTRLIRLLKLKKILIRFEEFFVSDFFILVIQFSKLLVFVLIIAHWGACFWYYIGYNGMLEHGVSWLVQTRLVDSSLIEQYISSVYFYITIMTTVGYGDIRAYNSDERLYCMFSMLVGGGVFAYVIGSVGTVLSLRYDAETIFKQKIMFVNQYLVAKNIHKDLRNKVKRYLEFVLENKRELKTDEEEVLGLLNPNLRDELAIYLHSQLIKNFIIINKYDEFCILLTKIMKEETLNPGENIFLKGDYSLKIYFINSGKVNINDNDVIYSQLNNKNYFGEIGFFGGQKRLTSADSVTFLNYTFIIMDLFKELAYKYRQINKEIFKEIKNELNNVRAKIRNQEYRVINVSCYLCGQDNHVSVNCNKLENFDEFLKLNLKKKKLSLEEKKKIFLNLHNINKTSLKKTSRRSSRRFSRRKSMSSSKISLPSFSKNTHEEFFSYIESDQEVNDIPGNNIVDQKFTVESKTNEVIILATELDKNINENILLLNK